ncbi:hypothetical protein WMF04_34390 [Sorangium sp. So ce260]|uniref:hypothetical protein n=1 Tax=Sorangium sp. So ce260 TaxID=3133291 RepID=UPI003F62E836
MSALRLSWLHRGPVISLAIALSCPLAGCGFIDESTCEHNGVEYSPGDTFPDDDGCNSCSCTEDGSVACTLMACIDGCTSNGVTHAPGEVFPAGCNTCVCMKDGTVVCTQIWCEVSCTYDGRDYAPGDSFPASDGCNTCTCDPSGSGEVGCTEIACHGCEQDGIGHAVGASFPSGDGCNTCTCNADGDIVCTEIACPAGCTYGGVEYAQGDSFPSLDGCNTCSCTPEGGVSCTERYCGCDPSREWWRQYVSTSPEECAVIDFACTGALTYVSNECGCGCEQDPSCPPSFDCKAPRACDLDEIQQRCPYSTIER